MFKEKIKVNLIILKMANIHRIGDYNDGGNGGNNNNQNNMYGRPQF